MHEVNIEGGIVLIEVKVVILDSLELSMEVCNAFQASDTLGQ